MHNKNIPLLVSIEFWENQTLIISYDDGTVWSIDCKPISKSSIYNRFLNDEYFKKAKINKARNTVERDQDLDMDGYGLYLELKLNYGTDK